MYFLLNKDKEEGKHAHFLTWFFTDRNLPNDLCECDCFLRLFGNRWWGQRLWTFYSFLYKHTFFPVMFFSLCCLHVTLTIFVEVLKHPAVNLFETQHTCWCINRIKFFILSTWCGVFYDMFIINLTVWLMRRNYNL